MASKKARGKRKKTRQLFKAKSKVTPNKVVEEISEGAVVQININPSYHSTLPFRRFQGKTGRVIGKQGAAYVVRFKLGNQEKEIVASSVHLNILNKPAKETVTETVTEQVVKEPKEVAKEPVKEKAVVTVKEGN